MKLLPVSLNVMERRCVVFGGGPVAARKAQSLCECGAEVVVISPHFCDEWRALEGQICRETRVYAPGDCADASLVFAGTNNREVNQQIAEEARRSGILCNVVDAPETSDFHSAATVRRGEVSIAIATGGSFPLLARHLRQKIEDVIGPEYEALLEIVASRRAELPTKLVEQSDRAEFWREVLNGPALSLLREGNGAGAKQMIDALFDSLNSEC